MRAKIKQVMPLFVVLLLLVTVMGHPAQDFNLTKVGQWGSAEHTSIDRSGNTVYCGTYNGLEVIDISNPTQPATISSFAVETGVTFLKVGGNYVYAVTGYEKVSIIDVSTPAAPVLVASIVDYSVLKLTVKGNYLYLGTRGGLIIMNVSNPAAAQVLSSITNIFAWHVCVSGNYAYVLDGSTRLKVYNVSNPAAPVETGSVTVPQNAQVVEVVGTKAVILTERWEDMTPEGELVLVDVSAPANPQITGSLDLGGNGLSVAINGNTVYVAQVAVFRVVDISSPTQPQLKGSYNGDYRALVNDGNRVFAAVGTGGFQVLDVTAPATVTVTGELDNTGEFYDLQLAGNYAYVVGDGHGLQIIDVSNPAAMTKVGHYKADVVRGVYVTGNKAYLAALHQGLKIVDVSNPSAPALLGEYDLEDPVEDLIVSGNYAYLTCVYSLVVMNISDPTHPLPIARLANLGYLYGEPAVQGNRLYLGADFGLVVLDISSPASPVELKRHRNLGYVYNVVADGDVVYCGGDGFAVIDVTNPATMKVLGVYNDSNSADGKMDVFGSSVLVADSTGLRVLDVSSPSQLKLKGQLEFSTNQSAARYHNGYIYSTGIFSGLLTAMQMTGNENPAQLAVDKMKLRFAAVPGGVSSGSQTFVISNPGSGSMDWSIFYSAGWINVSPSSGTGSAVITVSMNTDSMNYTYNNALYGYLYISSHQAVNAAAQVDIVCGLHQPNTVSAPFGELATPAAGALVSGSIAVTGWALDNVQVTDVKIFRELNGSLVYIGDADLVEGARPDVELVYPEYAGSYRAGWGYMLLTNFLPNQGNGTFKLHAVARDVEGNETTLGTRTIVCNNANAVKPFGAIDTPEQGGLASGNQYVNFGWALTPMPNYIPEDGSTIKVWVDGMELGNPVYNLFREDIADLFPDYHNSNGAVGYYYLNTADYDNGVHTIQWTVTDNVGNTDGIGSRYFTIQNTAGDAAAQVQAQQASQRSGHVADVKDIPLDTASPSTYIKGFRNDAEPRTLDSGKDCFISIQQMERVEIRPFAGTVDRLRGYLQVGDRLRPLPVGSTLDNVKHRFCWSLSPAFLGVYRLVFIKTSPSGQELRKDVIVEVK